MESLNCSGNTKQGQGYGIGSAANGKFYQFGLYDDKTRLTCLDSDSGTTVWEFDYDSDYKDLYGYDSGPDPRR